jgi:c-di-GMP-binding flagellar brake protein YcgR
MAQPATQREHPRVKPAAGQHIEVHIMGAGFLEVLRARDISIGGLAVIVAHGFRGYDINDPVDLVVKLGLERPFSARGIIRHQSKQASVPFFGIKFTEISADNLERVRRYVDKRLGEGGGA